MRLVLLKIKDVMTEKPFEIDVEQRIGKALGTMDKEHISTLIVRRDGELKGVISQRDIVEKGIDATAKVKVSMRKAPLLHIDQGLVEATDVLISSDFKAIPVVDGRSRLRGVLARPDIVKTVAISGAFNDVELRQVMSHPVLSITEDQTVGKARDTMLENDIRRLPVLDRMGNLRGIITLRDIAQIFYVQEREGMTRGERSGRVVARLSYPVKSIMSKPVYHLRIDDTVHKAAELMLDKNISGIPILNELGELVGILTQADILRLIAGLGKVEAAPVEIRGLEREEEFIRTTVRQAVNNKMAKLKRFTRDLQRVVITVKTYAKGGERKKYSVRANLETATMSLATRSYGWNLLKTVVECIDRLERKVFKERKRR